jgi:ligand-binding sensor domain-containing protein
MKYLATSIVLFFFIASTEILQAQWMQTNGPGGGVVNCFAFSGSNIFAGTDNGVYLSTNSGSSWTAVNNGLHEQVMALAVSGTNLIAGIHLDGIYLSTNNGTSWTAVYKGFTSVNAFAVNGTNIFASGGDGVLLSTNNGTSWAAVNNGLTIHPNITAIAVSGTNLIAGTYMDGVYLSTNNGTSWAAVTNGLPKYDWINAFTVSGTNLFAGYDLGGGYISQQIME